MITALESNEDIATAQRAFEDAFMQHAEESLTVDIGYQGGYARRDVIWMPSLDLWAHFGFPPSEKGPPNRYWNVFGVGKPSGMVSIACEINPPTEAGNNPPAGVFARDEGSRVIVLHRGKFTVTGGIKLKFVRSHFAGEWVQFIEKGNQMSGIKVAVIPSSRFGKDIRDFVLEVLRVKDLRRSPNP